jgi:hypothetical protein
LVPNVKGYIPSEEIMSDIIDMIEDVYRTITIVAQKTDLVLVVLNAFYIMALSCFWAGYINQTRRICDIVMEQDGRDKTLSKLCRKTVTKIEQRIQEKDVWEPRRAGMLIEKIED